MRDALSKAEELGEECPISVRRHLRPPECANRAYRPILSLQIVKGVLRLPCLGRVDSAADFCDFPMSFAHTSALNPLNQTPSATFGAGSGGPAQTDHFDVVLEFRWILRAGMKPRSPGLLGRAADSSPPRPLNKPFCRSRIRLGSSEAGHEHPASRIVLSRVHPGHAFASASRLRAAAPSGSVIISIHFGSGEPAAA